MTRLRHSHETHTAEAPGVADHLLDVVETDERAAKLDRYAERVRALGAAGTWTEKQVKEELENIAQMDDFVKNDSYAARRGVNSEVATPMRKVSRFFFGR